MEDQQAGEPGAAHRAQLVRQPGKQREREAGEQHLNEVMIDLQKSISITRASTNSNK